MFRQKLILAAVAVVVLTVMCGCDHGVRIDETNPNADVPTNTPISESGESATRETDAPEIEAEETTVINEADYIITDGVLTSYLGTNTVVYLPDSVTEIAENAFGDSPVADEITEINIGANVTEISPRAFDNLNKIGCVNVATDNPKYSFIDVFLSSTREGIYTCSYWAWFKEGADAAIYRKDNSNYPLPMRVNKIHTESPDEVVTVLCDGAELEISFVTEDYTGNYSARLHSIKYGEQVLEFDEPFSLTGNFSVYSFNFADGYVFTRRSTTDDAYIFTKDGIITLPWGNVRENGAVTLSCDENGSLCYHKENGEFASESRQTADPFSSIITGPDFYFGEDGRVDIVQGEYMFIPEITYTVEDYITYRHEMTMEEWFDEFVLFEFDSLEEMYQFNKENPYDYWSSRRVYYDTSVELEVCAYNGEDTVLYLPDAIKSIADNAFSSSSVADKITEINIGPKVEKISGKAFSGLPSLERVNIDPANPYFVTDGKSITDIEGSFSISIEASVGE
ncbi:MAG: hypothetical protein E7672_01835 [Ruminococcaceae bacterium]|nr:hypothetical protein [Oscillospiraceae bacterium]